MPRKPLIRTSEFPYHVTFRGNNKQVFPLPLKEVWKLFLNHFKEISARYDFQIYAFVLMINHVHLILSTPKKNLDEGMRFFLTETSRKMGSKSGRINHLYASPYKWKVIETETYLVNAFRYVYLNPVQDGLCLQAQDYDFSTIRQALGLEKLELPLKTHPEMAPAFSDKTFFLSWLNQPLSKKHWKALERASRMNPFRFPRDNNLRGAIKDLENHANVLCRYPVPTQNEHDISDAVL